MLNPESFVQFRDLPNFQSMFGNIGNSWNNALPNDLYIKGVPKNIFRGGNFVGNVGTGLDQLLSFTFPAKSLKTDLDLFRAVLAGGYGINDDDKRVQLSFGGNVIINTGLIDVDQRGYYFDITVIRIDSTHVNIGVSLVLGAFNIDSAGGIVSVGGRADSMNNNILAVNNMDTNSNILLLEAESATATNNNIIWNVGNVELTRF